MLKLTPMMKQYRQLKASVPDAILLFRLGDFYEMFYEDAKIASPVLEIALTARQTTPMCGFPHHASAGYIAKLIKAGYKAAICEQVEDAGPAKGIVKREITRIITPGTTVEEELLVSIKNNYLAAVTRLGKIYGIAHIDLSTGEFKVTEMDNLSEMVNELIRIQPSEVLLPPILNEGLKQERYLPQLKKATFTVLEEWFFDYELGYEALKKQFGTASLDGFGCGGLLPGIGVAGAIIQYIRENLRSSLDHVDSFTVYSTREFMVLDAVTQANLELVEPLRGDDHTGTLLNVLQQTVTPMGNRILRQWLLQPLLEIGAINERLDGVEELIRQRSILSDLREQLKAIRDIQRIIGRISCGSTNARELVHLRESLKAVPALKTKINKLKTGVWKGLEKELTDPPSLVDSLEKALVDAPPLTIKEGGMIKEGYDEELDELRDLTREGKDWISRYQGEEIKRTGIKSLKVRYNKIFGYYIEITKANLESVPPDYIRKQTLVNAERFITPGLKAWEDKVLGAQERANSRELHLFEELRDQVRQKACRIQGCARALGVIDVFAALAEVALSNHYIRPVMEDSRRLEIINGRHPVVEQTLVEERFVGNDSLMDGEENQILIITGPNMAGKSTYIRQVALIVLMAQVGSFVPADSARIGVADRIFARVGASDELARGQSTFMVEMTESANILHHATVDSLIILDEIGRGTSTFDGISIAWAVAEYLHNHAPSKARTLFATHYHELTELELTLPGVKNYNVAVREWNDRVIFLRKVIRGGTDKSYGIQVARLAGLPRMIIERAKLILAGLESGTLSDDGLPKFAQLPGKKRSGGENQLFLFPTDSHPVYEEIKNMNLEHMTPFEALQRLKELKNRVKIE